MKEVLLNLALKILKTLIINKVQNEKVRELVLHIVSVVVELVGVVTDKNPDDQAQIAELWQREKSGIVSFGMELLTEEVSTRISDPTNKELVIATIEGVSDIAKELYAPAIIQ